LHEFSGPLRLKWRFGGKIEKVDAMLNPMNSFLLLGVFTFVPVFVKIDEEMRPCTQIDRYADAQMQTSFIICSMLYAITMERIIKMHCNQLMLNLMPKCMCMFHVMNFLFFVNFVLYLDINSPAAKSKNISLCGEIMKLGTLLGDPCRIIFRLRPNSEMPPGGRHLEF